jgi:PPOX class probable F420-dependent enzyme
MAALSDDARALLTGRNFAHVATANADGSPHSVPVWIGVEGDRIVFFTQPATRKARNLDRDPRVAISLVDHENPYRTLQIWGRRVDTLQDDEALEVIDRLSERYIGAPFPMRSGVVFLIEPDRERLFELPFEH